MKKLILTFVALAPLISLLNAQQISKSYLDRTPAGFLPNEGQVVDQKGKANQEVHYLLSSGSMNIELKTGGFSFDLFEKKPVPRTYPESGFRTIEDKEEWDADQQYQVSVARIDVSLLGANKKAELVASNACDAYCNFYNGNIGVKGITKVPAYQQVMYKDIYPGIDLVFSVSEDGDQPSVEYSFTIHPGANPKEIKMEYKGCEQLSMDQRADLEMSNQKGWITQTAPSAYTETTEQPINCQWKLKNNIVSFAVASTSTKENIIIDPNIIWGTYYGGGGEQANGELALDKKDNIYATGSTSSSAGVATSGAYQTTYAGAQDVFLGKFTKMGKLLWSTYYGGTDQEIAWSVATDPSNNAFIAGSTQSISQIATPGTHQDTLNGTKDIYIAKFDPTGALLWGSYYGGSKTEQARSVTCDNDGNAYLGCYVESADGISTQGTYQYVYGGNGDAALAKFSPTGQLLWGTYFSGTGEDRFHSVYADSKGNVFAAGTVESTNLATPGAFQTTFGGDEDGIVAKFNAANGQLFWATYFGGVKEDHSRGVLTDKKGNVYVVGFTQSCNQIAYGNSFQSTFGGSCNASDTTYDGFLAKFSPSGSKCLWSSYWGGSQNDFFYGIALDSKNDLFAGGNTLSDNLLTTSNAFQDTLAGDRDGNLVETDSLGNLLYATYFGSAADESMYDINMDENNVLYMFEQTNGNAFITPGAYKTVAPPGKLYALYKFNSTRICDDVNEPNESMTQAAKITYTTDTTLYGYTAAISKPADQDWFSVKTVVANPYINVLLKDNQSQKYSVDLYNKSGKLLKQGLPDANGNVSIIYNGQTKASTYYIQIVHTSLQFDSVNCYRVLVIASPSAFNPIAERSVSAIPSAQLSIQPNPVNDLFRLRFSTDKSASAVIRVYNVEQQLVFQTSLTTVSGDNEMMIKLPILSSGEYLLQWQQEGDVRSEKFIVAPSK